MAGRPPNESLAVAKLVGDKTYEGSLHSACGTNLRYVSGGGCVHCARTKQTEMRDALKARLAAYDDPATLTPENHPAISNPWD